MIRVRIDDVFVDSSAFTDEKAIARFKQIHRWIIQVPDKAIHIPTILVTEIQNYPEVIKFVKEETAEGRMSPQLHGFEHIDYAKLPESEIKDHLEKSIEWMDKNLDVQPTTWCTPWGGYNQTMQNAADACYLTVETTGGTLSPGKAVKTATDHGPDVLIRNHRTIMAHWWERGLQILRLVEIVKYGSYTEAKYWDKETRRRKERIF